MTARVAGRVGNETNVSLLGATRVEAVGSRPAEEENIKLDKNTTYESSDRAYHIPARYRSQVEQLWSRGGLACTLTPANALRNEVVGREASHSEDHLAMHMGLRMSETLTVKHCAVGLFV
jgi:hypothetical protein